MKNTSRSIFDYNDYKKFLKDLIGERWGSLSKLSDAAQCQKSYLSKAIHKEVHITPEQAFRLSQHLGHSELERDYFILLVDRDRSGDRNHRDLLSTKLTKLKREFEISAKGASKKSVTHDFQMLGYYTKLDWMMIHYLTSVPRLRTPQKIAQYLNLQIAYVENILKDLEGLGMVEKKGVEYRFQSGDEHLTENHPLLPIFHRLVREKAMSAKSHSANSVHFSALQTVSSEDVEKIKILLLKTIESFHKIARPSDPEELIAISLDYFLPSDT